MDTGDLPGKLGFTNEFIEKKDVGAMGTMISGGEKQRLSILRAMMENGFVYIFDEPTSALDPDTKNKIDDFIFKIKGKTIFVITHNWDENYLSKFDEVIKIS